MELKSMSEIRNKYLAALASDSQYEAELTELKLKDKHLPISNFKALNPEEAPDYLKESREMQEILLDITAINNSVIEMKDRVDDIIGSIDAVVTDVNETLKREEDRIQDINMICGTSDEYNAVIAVPAGAFGDGSEFEALDQNTVGAKLLNREVVPYEITSISGNGIEGNKYVFDNGVMESEVNDYSKHEYITDDSDITFFEYERFVSTERSEIRDAIINYDNKPCECVITLKADIRVCRMKLLSETQDLVLRQLEISDDGINWKPCFNKELKLNSRDDMYSDARYIYGSGVLCFPYSAYIRLTVASNATVEDTIKVEDVCERTKRKKIRINNIKLYSSDYTTADIVTDNILAAGSMDKIAVFASEYVPDHFTGQCVKYYLIVNGVEYEVVPVNNKRNDAISIIKYSEVGDALNTVTGTKLIDETIKSAKLRITIKDFNGGETPYVSNIKLLLAKDTGSIYV